MTSVIVTGTRPGPEPFGAGTAQAPAPQATPAARSAQGTEARETSAGWTVAPARPGDRAALEALFAACSEDSVRLRFFGRSRAFPREYLAAALAGVPTAHDAVVAYRGGDRTRLAGLASLVAGPSAPAADGAAPRAGMVGPAQADPAELAVLVADAWQRQGAGTAMITALLARARERGVVHVRASVLPGRRGLLAALSHRLPAEPGRSSYTRDGLSVVYKLR
ncbi:GNAT family N-acetyltransferase [Actinacidiphila acidipaludis]|uniref:GNAT family N-acetyltransferase n=1 Tax=Actinacidiphila acidipaludis TaxID=2873382 RepID=A0ABS7Q6U1_9ACTN|nr:GNAT family N-acetyltransferase [Streptomyces acidipaludis]MBY8877499.1 GNAT family N-acetyltransferase [Streptomyces acidipaludis]